MAWWFAALSVAVGLASWRLGRGERGDAAIELTRDQQVEARGSRVVLVPGASTRAVVASDEEDSERESTEEQEDEAKPETRGGSPTDAQIADMLAQIIELKETGFPLDPNLLLEEEFVIAGDVTGVLRSESGRWPGAPFFDEPDTLFLELVTDGETSAGTRVERRAVLEPAEESGQRVMTFRFADVPEGQYELTLSTLDPHAWSHESMIVTPPQSGIEFVRHDLGETSGFSFRVFDAATGAEIESFDAWRIEQSISETNGVFLHAGPFPTDAVPANAPLLWSVYAPGYAPSFGDERAFDQTDEAGGIVADVRLERGWAAWVCVMGPDPTVKPLSGVRAALDGEWNSSASDSRGLLELRAASAPTELTFDRAGWSVARGEVLPLGSAQAQRRGYVLPYLLKPAD